MPTLPVPVAMAVAIYFTMWWTVLFAVLPFGVRPQDEAQRSPGSDAGAPARPMLLAKAIWTTVISAALFAALMLLIAYGAFG